MPGGTAGMLTKCNPAASALQQSTWVDVQETRAAMLDWIADAIESNAKERSKMKMDIQEAAPHGFFVNLNAVLLQMCEPFLDPLSGKAWGKLDAG